MGTLSLPEFGKNKKFNQSTTIARSALQIISARAEQLLTAVQRRSTALTEASSCSEMVLTGTRAQAHQDRKAQYTLTLFQPSIQSSFQYLRPTCFSHSTRRFCPSRVPKKTKRPRRNAFMYGVTDATCSPPCQSGSSLHNFSLFTGVWSFLVFAWLFVPAKPANMAVGKNKLATKGGKRGGKKKCATNDLKHLYVLYVACKCRAAHMIAWGAATDASVGAAGQSIPS